MLFELLQHGGVNASMAGASLEACLRELIPSIVPDKSDYGIASTIEAIMERERVKSTVFGAVAFPHARIQMTGAAALNIGFHKAGVDLGAGKLTHVFFVVLAAPSAQNELLSVMACASRLVKMTDFLPRLLAGGGIDLYKILMEEEGKLP